MMCACSTQELSYTVPDTMQPAEWATSLKLLNGLKTHLGLTYSPAMAAYELLLWGKQHLWRALKADRLAELDAGQHHIRSLSACDQAVAVIPHSEEVFLAVGFQPNAGL